MPLFDSENPKFQMSVSEQVVTNLVHYNLWSNVKSHIEEVKSPNDGPKFAILSGMPPEKLDQLDVERQREWVIAKLMDCQTCDMKEIELYFDAVGKLDHRPKRLTLGLVNDDGTVTYYFIHDGLIKPRQN